MSTAKKRPPCEVARLAALCKRLGIPSPRHVKANDHVILWVDARDYLHALQKLAEAYGVR